MTNRTGVIRWQTGFICRRTGFIRPAVEASQPSDEASPPANEASPPANEASPFGLYIFTNLPLAFLVVYCSLFFHAQKWRITPLLCPFNACSFKIDIVKK